MTQYLCRCLTPENRIVEEKIQAEDRSELLSSLSEKGYRVIRTEVVQSRGLKLQLGPKHIRKKSVTLFCRQMSALLTSGIPTVKCFDIIGSQSEDKVFKVLMTELTADVSSGSSLSKAMGKHPDDFPPMLTEMVKIGEVTGDLNGVLLRMAEQYEREARINQKIKSALSYPIVVLCVAIAAVIFMLIKVVPSFVDIFDSLGAELPMMTQILLSVSTLLTERWYIVIIAVPAVIVLLVKLFRTRSVRRAIDKLKVTMRGLRGPMQKLTSARFARTLYTLISSGVPIVQALEYTKNNVRNLYVEEAIDGLILAVRQGKDLAAEMAETNVFPKLLVSMISVGESSGDMEGMLCKCADYFDEETTSAVDQLMTVIEPAMVVIVGLLIGVIVLALYAPMFGAISAMREAV